MINSYVYFNFFLKVTNQTFRLKGRSNFKQFDMVEKAIIL